MRKVNIHEAKTTLSKLVEAAEAGEEVVLARAGKPVVRLVPVGQPRGIKLDVARGLFPKKLLDEIGKPLSKAELSKLFGGPLEP